MKKIILFGTNDKAEIFVRDSNSQISYVIDTEESKWGTRFLDYDVVSPSQLMEEEWGGLQVILAFTPSGAAFKHVARLLTEMGLKENEHFISMLDAFPANYPYEELRPRNEYAPWKADQEFVKVFNAIRNHTLVDQYRAYSLWSCIEQVSSVPGALIEVGVWKGGTGALIASQAAQYGIAEKVYLCDTFSGVVKASKEFDNAYRGGEHSDTSESVVRALVQQLELNNVRILKGIFPDETAADIIEPAFRFCHIDVDVYLSAKHVFEWVWDRMEVGGVVVFDDYGFMACQGVTQLVNELKHRSDLFFSYNLNGQAIIVKHSKKR